MILPIHSPHLIETAVETLKKGKPIIAPGDTIYGILGIVPDSDSAIRELKGREETKPFLQLIQKQWIYELSAQPIDDELLRFWPGPLTAVVRDKNGATTAFRAPDDDFLQSLLQSLQQPLYSTSVNLAGQPPLQDIHEIIQTFYGKVEVIIDGGELKGGLPSTLLDITGKSWKILRQGACKVPIE